MNGAHLEAFTEKAPLMLQTNETYRHVSADEIYHPVPLSRLKYAAVFKKMEKSFLQCNLVL